MILLVDNYDSFTYNLVQRLGEIDASLDIEVHRNDKISPAEIERRSPSHLIISPGPCTPNEAGISVDCISRFMGADADLGSLPRASIDRASNGQHDRSCQASDARESGPSLSRQPRHLHRPGQSLSGDPLSQLGDSAPTHSMTVHDDRLV